LGYARRVEGRRRIRLEQFDPKEDGGLTRSEAEKKSAQYIDELVELEELLYTTQLRSLLVILQGRDTSGKDGTIRQVAGQLPPQGCSTAVFKVPTEEERAHDFLWRVHARTPRTG
jgi:polyphosphate kinase 2 (PPK2 family)